MMKDIKIIELQSMKCMAIEVEVENEKIPVVMASLFQDLSIFFQKSGVAMVGPPFTYYHSWGDRKTRMTVGFPVSHQVEGDDRVKPFTLPSGKAVYAMHIGPYEMLVDTYGAMHHWMSEKNLTPAGEMWEIYLTDPHMEKDPEKWMTALYWPCK